MGYVEMLYEDEDEDKKLYLNRQKLASMHWGDSFWTGRQGYPAYEWANIKQDIITTAEDAIKQEPEPKKTGWETLKKLVGHTGEEQHGEDVPALLTQLQELGCRD